MATIRAGRKNRRFYLQSPPTTKNGLNEIVGGWTTRMTVVGDMRGETGLTSIRNSGSSDVVAGALRYSLRVNYNLSINDAMRALDDNGTIYSIPAGGVKHDIAGRRWTDIVLQVGKVDDR